MSKKRNVSTDARGDLGCPSVFRHSDEASDQAVAFSFPCVRKQTSEIASLRFQEVALLARLHFPFSSLLLPSFCFNNFDTACRCKKQRILRRGTFEITFSLLFVAVFFSSFVRYPFSLPAWFYFRRSTFLSFSSCNFKISWQSESKLLRLYVETDERFPKNRKKKVTVPLYIFFFFSSSLPKKFEHWEQSAFSVFGVWIWVPTEEKAKINCNAL